MISHAASPDELRESAQKEGLKTLLQNALIKVRNGLTTLDEVLSVCATQSEGCG